VFLNKKLLWGLMLLTLFCSSVMAEEIVTENITNDVVPVIKIDTSEVIQINAKYAEPARETWAPYRKFSQTEIQKTNSDTVKNYLTRESSFYSVGQSSPALLSTASLRGISSARLLVMFDDLPLNNGYTGGANLSVIPPEFLGEVEILKTGGSSIYGADALGGVISLRSRTSQNLNTTQFDYVISGGSDGNNRSSLMHQTSSGDLFFKTIVGQAGGEGFRDNSDYHQLFLLEKINYQFKPDILMNVQVRYYGSETGLPGPKPKAGTLGNFSNNDQVNSLFDRQSDNELGLAFKTDFTVSQTLKLFYLLGMEQNNLSAKSKYFDSISPTPNQHLYENKINSTVLTQKIDLLIDHSPLQKTIVGAELKQFQYNNSGTDTNLNNSVTSIIDDSFKTNAQALWIVEKISPANDLFLSGGLRLDSQKAYGSQLSPHVGANYNLNQNFLVKAAMSRSFRAPNPSEILGTGINIDLTTLKSETATNFDLGFEYLWGTQTHLVTEIFYKDIDNMIQFIPSSNSYYYPENIEKAKIKGLEFTIQHYWNESWKSDYSITLMQNIQTRKEVNNISTGAFNFVDRTLSDLPETIQVLGLEYQSEGGFFGRLQARYVGVRYKYYEQTVVTTVTYQTKVLDPFVTIDFYLSQKLNDTFSVFGRIDNIFNADYSEQFGTTLVDRNYPGAPRFITLGLKGQF
jgi:outer membrane receptor protein involved in Fe transport